MKKTVRITESDLVRIIEKVVNEQQDTRKLVDRETLIKKLRGAPRNLKIMAIELPTETCFDMEGNERKCVRIPEVIQVYLSGKY